MNDLSIYQVCVLPKEELRGAKIWSALLLTLAATSANQIEWRSGLTID